MPTQRTLREVISNFQDASLYVRGAKEYDKLIDQATSEIKSLIKGKLPEANNLDKAEKELEHDSPELNQMIGWNKALTEIEEIVEEL